MVGYKFLSRIQIHKNNNETDKSGSASLCTVDLVLMSQIKMANVALNCLVCGGLRTTQLCLYFILTRHDKVLRGPLGQLQRRDNLIKIKLSFHIKLSIYFMFLILYIFTIISMHCFKYLQFRKHLIKILSLFIFERQI